MNKIRIIAVLILLALSGNAQETLIVRGYLERPNTRASINLQKNMFCYLKGGYIMPEYSSFCTFRVDSVIGGSFLNFRNEINQPPFNIKVALINECTILDYQRSYTLRIKLFPYTNYYYIDNLTQVAPNEKYADKLIEYHKNYQQKKAILAKGTLQEKHDFLAKIQRYDYTSQHSDYRHVSHILPFMTSEDTIINYNIFYWDAIDKNGRMVGGSEISEEKGVFSDFLYDYLDGTLPFTLPQKTTDSIGWHAWFDSVSCSQKFSAVKYAQAEHKTVVLAGVNTNYISYFIPDVSSRIVYFASNRKLYSLNLNTDKLSEKPSPQSCQIAKTNNINYSIKNNEIADYNPFNKCIALSKLDNGAFYQQDENIIPLNLRYNETPSSAYIYPNLIVHSNTDFLIFTSQNPDGYNCLNVEKINRKGEWVVKPKSLYQKTCKSYVGDTDDIGAFSFYQSDESETTFVFSDKTFSKKSYGANEKYTTAIAVYKLNANLEVQDSLILTMDFSPFNYTFSKTHLLKKDSTYLLLAQTSSNSNNQLYYKLLNNDLTPRGDFVKLANHLQSYNAASKPIVTTEGFMISWVDNDLSEGILRSVLVSKSGKQSETINVFNQRIDDIYNVEFDEDNVDIYLFNRDEQALIRKRIDKKEYQQQ